MNWATIPQMVLGRSKTHGDRCALRAKETEAYRNISWKEMASQIEAVALGLLDIGVQPGDRVAILSENRPEWVYADVGALSVGAVTVPIYTTLTSSEIEYILRNAGAQFLFVSTPELMGKVISFQEALDLKVILFDAPYRVSGPRVWWIGELLGLGKTAGPESKQTLALRIQEGKSDALASIIYTSGTTGEPKGVMLTHANFLSNCQAIEEALPIGENDSTLSFLPLSHVFERTAGYYFVLSVGGTIAYAENIEAVPINLLEVRPTILTAVPRFYEKMHERIQETIRNSSFVKRWIFAWARRIAQKKVQAETDGRKPHPLLKLQMKIADQLVFSKLRARMGGRLRLCISGGAPLSKELAEFFYCSGLLILEGYGLTETSPVITANRADHFRFGSVGLALPGIEVRIAPDGEVLTRGPHVMRGYFNNPTATAEVMDAEGWFHTGDIGALSPEGFLTITDRKKDLIKTSGGKMVAPQRLEKILKSDPLIADCVVIGDKRKYLAALIVPNIPRLESWARERGIPFTDTESLLRQAEVVELLWDKVDQLNHQLASFEQLKRISLLGEPFTLASGELTPTLKVKRRVVEERYHSHIEAMYRG